MPLASPGLPSAARRPGCAGQAQLRVGAWARGAAGGGSNFKLPLTGKVLR